MTKPPFGTLKDISLREAWAHEAHNFTPWLASNLDKLGEAVGLSLELVEAEAGLPTDDDAFSADILARNDYDDTNVLIENQLEGSDHKHLGQVLTYLAGLEAKSVIWIARSFRDSHLAAIKWLNENTLEKFSFFAVKIRVVQIADSPFAPLFEVIEQPNTWERQTRSKARIANQLSPTGQKRKIFWTRFLETYPAHSKDGKPGGISTFWRKLPGTELVISYYIASKSVGLFIRGEENVPREETEVLLEPHRDILEKVLGTKFHTTFSKNILSSRLSCDFSDEAQFDEIARWLNKHVELYENTLTELLGDED